MGEHYESVKEVEIDFQTPPAASTVLIDGKALYVSYLKLEIVPGDVMIHIEAYLRPQDWKHDDQKAKVRYIKGELLVSKDALEKLDIPASEAGKEGE